jgi:hypothetical protein
MRNSAVILLYAGWMVFIVCIVIVVSRRRVKAMQAAAQKAGLSGVRTSFLGRVTGSWRGYTVTLRMFGGGKSGPERAVVEIAAATPARLSIHRRASLDMNFSPFGPPVVQTAFDGEYVVRSDDIMLAQRLLGDAKIADALRATLIERMDRLELATSRVRATRVVRSISRDQALLFAWELAAVVVEKLGLPPV